MQDLTLTAADDPALRPHHLSVDGMSPQGPNLSHWPGNRTPHELKADLSTGICLRFARAPKSERVGWLAGANQVLNDHYDTDGFLSLLAILRPEVAQAREEVCLLAAATGDYGAFSTDRAFAIDRIVLNLGREEGSPLAGTLEGRSTAMRNHLRYQWLLQHAEDVLDRPERLASLFETELTAMRRALDAARCGGLRRVLRHDVGLAILTTDADVPRMVLNTLGALHRVLHVRAAATGGWLYRLHERTESWFEMVTIAPPPRRDLRPLATRLQELEAASGRMHPGAQWCADDPTEPIPEVYFGVPGEQAYGEVTRQLAPSALAPEIVVATLTGFWREPPACSGPAAASAG